MNLADATFARLAAMSMENARTNAPQVKRSVADLRRHERALVIASGPSLDPASLRRDQRTAVVCVDGALHKMGSICPDLVVSCDPHPRIAHWFGAPADEYFDRTSVGRDTPSVIRRPGIPLAVATASHPSTVRYALEAGLVPYWFHAMLDDPGTDGLTRELWNAKPLPVVNGGGNVGTAAWVIASDILGAKEIALVGFDFGYPPDFPRERTQYFPEMKTLGVDYVAYPSGWYTDPTMLWFRDVLAGMIRESSCRTVDCSASGALGIERVKLEEWLA